MKQKETDLELMLHDQMIDMLARGTSLDRDRTRVLALVKVLPKYIESMMNEKGEKKNEQGTSKTKKGAKPSSTKR